MKLAVTFGIYAIVIMMSGTPFLISLDNNNNYMSAFAQTGSQGNIGIMNFISSINNSTNSAPNAAVNSLNFTTATGNIASLQNDASGKPAWLLSGPWQLLVFKPRLEENKTQPATVAFNSVFDMVLLNGTAKHEHAMSITDFNLTGVNNSVSTTTFNGTSKINVMGSPQNNVPVIIKIMDGGTISVWVDPSKINNHFGNTPIYGIITRKSG